MAVDKLVDSAQLNSDLTLVANAIRSKSGGSGSLSFPSGFISEIGNIPSGGGGSVSEGALNFFDADGNIVESYSKAEALALESLPENPTKTGLVPQGWNWTLAEIKSYYTSCPDGIINVGQIYTTNDGKTRIYIHLEEERKSPILGVCPNGTVDVDWGDGTTHDTLTGTSLTSYKWTPTHNYSHGGDYVIQLTVTGSASITGGSSNGTYCPLLRHSSTSNAINHYYVRCITRVEIGNNISSIGAGGFYYCSNMETISISSNVTSFDNYSFYGCLSLKYISMPRSISKFGSFALACNYNIDTISLPGDLSTLGESSFISDYSLKKITIPKNITQIPANAFYSCESLENIYLPNGITKVGNTAFKWCKALNDITIPSTATEIGANTFFECFCLNGVSIPNGVTKIGDSAFENCYSLENITIPSSLTTIGGRLLMSANLKSVTVNIPTITNSMFYNNYSLKNVNIQNNVTAIEGYAFYNCYSIVKLVIPSSVTTIAAYAFAYCSSISEFHFLGTTPPTLVNVNAFSNIPADSYTIYVPVGSLEAYQTATKWSTYASRMQEEPQ